LDSEATEAIGAPYFRRPDENRFLNLLAKLLPFDSIERWTRLYDADLFVAKRELDSAGRAGKRKMKLIRVIGSPGILTGPSDTPIEEEPQFKRIEVRPCGP